jgi:hypothetical protein
VEGGGGGGMAMGRGGVGRVLVKDRFEEAVSFRGRKQWRGQFLLESRGKARDCELRKN